jgi:hypothetical protein
LLWIARCTRPYISYAVHRATRRAHAPTVSDWKLAKRIFRYLSVSADTKLRMKPSGHHRGQLNVSDADYASDKDDGKSVSGIMIKVNEMLVGWQSKKQGAVALSTAETEFVAAAAGAKHILGVKQLCEDIGFTVKVPMRMSMDNQASIKQVESEASSAQAKHVDVMRRFFTTTKTSECCS